MAIKSVTYTGPLGACRVRLPGGSVSFRRGEPVDVSAEDAKTLATDLDFGGKPAKAEPTPTTAPADKEKKS